MKKLVLIIFCLILCALPGDCKRPHHPHHPPHHNIYYRRPHHHRPPVVIYPKPTTGLILCPGCNLIYIDKSYKFCNNCRKYDPIRKRKNRIYTYRRHGRYIR